MMVAIAAAAAIGARRIFVDGLVRRTPGDSDSGRNTPEAFHLLAYRTLFLV
jgi:hypothetical protein